MVVNAYRCLGPYSQHIGERFREEEESQQLSNISARVEDATYFVEITTQIHGNGEEPIFVVDGAPFLGV